MAEAADRLIGRDAEIAVLDAALADLAEGRPRTIQIVGEPGIGKTRLLADLAGRAEARGMIVLEGCSAELERDLPFWVFVDALDEYVAGREPRLLGSLDDGDRAELSLLLPSLPRPPESRPPAIHDERYRAHRAVRTLLERLARGRPLVLILDDLHWADPASVELIGALQRRPPAAAVLTAMAMRHRQGPERLVAALERARRSGTLERLELRALTADEAADLLGDAFVAADAALLYEASGGNPLYLRELARSPVPGARTAPAGWHGQPAAGGLDVPQAVAAGVAEELTMLSANARRVVEGASVAGDPFEIELAAAAAAESESSVIEAVDELFRFDLIRSTDAPRRLRFRHPLVRRAIYDSTPVGWRLGAHERSAAALAARGADAGARAHHVERSARPGDAAAARTLREAGSRSAARAPASAARWFAAALRVLPPSAPPLERVELLLADAEALGAIGRLEDSRAALIESLAIVPDEAIGLRARLTATCAGIEHLIGLHDQAHDRLTDALDRLADQASPEAVAFMVELVFDASYRMEFDSARGWAAEALDSARDLDDAALTAAAAAALAISSTWAGATTAEAECREAADRVDALPDEQLARRLDAAINVAVAEACLDRFAGAEAHAERLLLVGRATGQGQLFSYAYATLGFVWRIRGELDKAAEELEGAIDSARLAENDQMLAWNLFSQSMVVLLVGDVQTALAHAQESVDLTREVPGSLVAAWAAVALAGVLLETGDAERAVEVLVGSAGGEELTYIPGGWRVHCLELLSRCRLALGRMDEARSAAVAAESAAAAVGLPLASAFALRAAAAVALASGDPDDAARHALASAAAAEEVEAGLEAALSRTLAGRALAAAGDREAALAELRRAVDDLDAYGAARHRSAAERELRRLGHRIHRRTRRGATAGEGIASLTARELEIARLVVDRRTNSQIASALFLSRRTVETHLQNIFRKLDVSSRVAVAKALEHADREAAAG